MQKTVRNALLFLAGACLAVSVGLGIFLRPPLKSGVLPAPKPRYSPAMAAATTPW